MCHVGFIERKWESCITSSIPPYMYRRRIYLGYLFVFSTVSLFVMLLMYWHVWMTVIQLNIDDFTRRCLLPTFNYFLKFFRFRLFDRFFCVLNNLNKSQIVSIMCWNLNDLAAQQNNNKWVCRLLLGQGHLSLHLPHQNVS